MAVFSAPPVDCIALSFVFSRVFVGNSHGNLALIDLRNKGQCFIHSICNSHNRCLSLVNSNVNFVAGELKYFVRAVLF